MNILLIIPEVSGTIASVSYNLYVGLKERNEHQVYVADLSGKNNRGFPFDNIYRISFENYFGGQYLKDLYRIFFLKRIKRELNIDVSISTLIGCNICNALSKGKDKTIGVFHTRLGQMRRHGFFYYYLHALLLRVSHRKLDRLVAVNRTAQMDMMRFTKRNDVDLIYNIHLFDRIKDKSVENLDNSFEEKLFQKPVVLFVGHLFNIKAPDRLVNAFVKVKSICTDAQLVYIGANTENFKEEAMDSLIAKYSLGDDIHFLGEKNNPYKYMSRCRLLVSPSRDEGLPGVLIEALSLGKPVVATNSSLGVWEIMGCDNDYNISLKASYTSKCGIITSNTDDETNNVNELANAICKVLSGEFSFLGFDQTKFDAQNIVSKYIKGYEK